MARISTVSATVPDCGTNPPERASPRDGYTDLYIATEDLPGIPLNPAIIDEETEPTPAIAATPRARQARNTRRKKQRRALTSRNNKGDTKISHQALCLSAVHQCNAFSFSRPARLTSLTILPSAMEITRLQCSANAISCVISIRVVP